MKATAAAKRISERIIETLTSDAKHLDAQTPEGALARGRAYALARYDEDAVESFREAARQTNLHEAHARLSIMQIRTGDLTGAVKTAMDLAARAPDFALAEMTSDDVVSAFTLLGNALTAADRMKDALAAYEGAMKHCPKDTSAPAMLAQVHIALGSHAEAAKLAPAFAKNARFADLAALVKLGKAGDALMPSMTRSQLASAVAAHGRPLVVAGTARLAPVVERDDWSSDIPGLAP